MKQENKEQEALDASVLQDMRDIKKQLKQMTKNQLIAMVFQQMGRAMEQQNINQILVEKLELKEGPKNETNS